MVAVSKILTVCATIGNTIALPLAMSSPLSEDTDGKMALSRRSKETIETPDFMWDPPEEERIRRSKESIRSASIMWGLPDDDSTSLSE